MIVGRRDDQMIDLATLSKKELMKELQTVLNMDNQLRLRIHNCENKRSKVISKKRRIVDDINQKPQQDKFNKKINDFRSIIAIIEFILLIIAVVLFFYALAKFLGNFRLELKASSEASDIWNQMTLNKISHDEGGALWSAAKQKADSYSEANSQFALLMQHCFFGGLFCLVDLTLKILSTLIFLPITIPFKIKMKRYRENIAPKLLEENQELKELKEQEEKLSSEISKAKNGLLEIRKRNNLAKRYHEWENVLLDYLKTNQADTLKEAIQTLENSWKHQEIKRQQEIIGKQHQQQMKALADQQRALANHQQQQLNNIQDQLSEINNRF